MNLVLPNWIDWLMMSLGGRGGGILLSLPPGMWITYTLPYPALHIAHGDLNSGPRVSASSVSLLTFEMFQRKIDLLFLYLYFFSPLRENKKLGFLQE